MTDSCIPGWFNPNYATPDYYNSCSSNSAFSVPANSIGYHPAQEGNAYIGLLLYIGFDSREYLETKLSQPLEAGKEYCVTIYARFSRRFIYATDAIGIYFTSDSLLNDTNSQYFNFQPQITNVPGNVITDTLNWTIISGSFIANGNEHFATIGNFKSDNNTNLDTLSSGIDPRCYYIFDNFSVYLCEDTIPDSSPTEMLFPSLLSGQEHLFINNLPSNTRLEIFDSRGRTVYFNDNYDNRFSAAQAEAGIYFYCFIFPGGETRKGKILITR